MSSNLGPRPGVRYPIKDQPRVIFLKNFIRAPNIEVGDYTYFDDHRGIGEKFDGENVLYNYDTERVKLVIGKFCAIAAETKFIMTGNHKLDAISTYPFPIFGQGWEKAFGFDEFPMKGDIVVGHDVWFGYDALVLPGVHIGHGAVVAARAVVAKDVPPYTIVAGNPARVVKHRFDETATRRLLEIAWWDWEIEKIEKVLPQICQLDIDALERVAES